MLLTGPSGCGKTFNILSVLSDLKNNFQFQSISLSFMTSASLTQDQIDSKLERKRKGFYGPPLG